VATGKTGGCPDGMRLVMWCLNKGSRGLQAEAVRDTVIP
jgi:hypothetical protein